MSKGITCSTAQQANEYVTNLREQGYDSKAFRDNTTGTYRVVITGSRQRAQKGTVQSSLRSTAGGGIVKAAGMIGKGFGDIGKSLSTPSTSRRPRISQLPASRREMGIAQSYDLSKMKMPTLRGRDISGRRRG